MTVNDILLHKGSEVVTIEPTATLAAVVRILVRQRIGALLVTGADHRIVGIISERDVVRAFAKDGARLADMHVRDLMTREVTTCALDTPMVEAEKLMNKRRVRHLPVVDSGKLVGMLSIRDVMVWRQQEARDEANVLREAMIAVRNR